MCVNVYIDQFQSCRSTLEVTVLRPLNGCRLRSGTIVLREQKIFVRSGGGGLFNNNNTNSNSELCFGLCRLRCADTSWQMAPSKRQFAQAAASNTEMRLPGRITRSGASRNLEVPMATVSSFCQLQACAEVGSQGPFSGSGSPRGSSPASTIEEAPEASQTLQEAAAPGAVEEAAGPAEIGEKGTEVGSEVAEVPAEVGTELVPEVAGGPAVEGEAAANDVLDIADQDVNNVEAGEPIHHAEDAGLQLAQQEEQAPGGELPEEDMQGLQILLGGVVIPGAAALGPGPARIVAGKRVDGARCSRCLKTGVPERLCFPKAPTAPKGFANAPACCMRCSLKKEGKQCESRSELEQYQVLADVCFRSTYLG